MYSDEEKCCTHCAFVIIVYQGKSYLLGEIRLRPVSKLIIVFQES